MVGQRGNDPAVKMAEELHQVVPACQGDFGAARLNGDDAETGGVAKALRVDGLGEARRVQGGAEGAGLSMAVYLGGLSCIRRTGVEQMRRSSPRDLSRMGRHSASMPARTWECVPGGIRCRARSWKARAS